jgi:hypothetical protein
MHPGLSGEMSAPKYGMSNWLSNASAHGGRYSWEGWRIMTLDVGH